MQIVNQKYLDLEILPEEARIELLDFYRSLIQPVSQVSKKNQEEDMKEIRSLLIVFLLPSIVFAGGFNIISNGKSGWGHYDEQSGNYYIYYEDGSYIDGHISPSGHFRQMDNRNNVSIGYYDRESGNFYIDGEYGVIEGSGNYYKYDGDELTEHGVIIWDQRN